MTDGVLEKLVPHHRPFSDRMDSAASCTQVWVNFHSIDQHVDSFGLEIDVAAKQWLENGLTS